MLTFQDLTSNFDISKFYPRLGFPGGSDCKESAWNQETRVRSMGWEDPLEEMVTHSSILAWRIPWTEEPGKLQFMELQRVIHDWLTLSLFYHFALLLQRNKKQELVKCDYSGKEYVYFVGNKVWCRENKIPWESIKLERIFSVQK